MFHTIYMDQFGWFSERGGNFFNLLQKEGGSKKGVTVHANCEGLPNKVIMVTDHQPLWSIFNRKEKRSIRSERNLLRHCHSSKSFPTDHQTEVEAMNKLLYIYIPSAFNSNHGLYRYHHNM